MRPLSGAFVATLLVTLAGCRERWLLGPLSDPPPAAEVLAWTSLDLGEVDILEQRSHGSVSYRLQLTEQARSMPPQRLELQFRQRLDGAKVDVYGAGPRHTLTLLHGKRVGGDTIAVPLAPLELERVEVVVHHHLRPLPLIQAIRLGRRAP